MAQGGDPTGTGRGGESIYGGKFRDEITRELKHVGAGVLAMANSGPHTNGSQFYITLAPAPWLDGKHSIFGRIASGMGAVRKLGMVPVDANDGPSTTITVRRLPVYDFRFAFAIYDGGTSPRARPWGCRDGKFRTALTPPHPRNGPMSTRHRRRGSAAAQRRHSAFASLARSWSLTRQSQKL